MWYQSYFVLAVGYKSAFHKFMVVTVFYVSKYDQKRGFGEKKIFGPNKKKCNFFLAINLQKQAKNHIFPNILKTNRKFGTFDNILQKADKISEILNFFYQNRINGSDFRDFRSSKSVQRVEKTRLKSSFQGRNIIFKEKCLTVTNIIFFILGGVTIQLLAKKST